MLILLKNFDVCVMEFLPNLLQHMKELRNVTTAVTNNHPEKNIKITMKERINFNVIGVR